MSAHPAPHLRPEIPLIWRATDRVHFGDHATPITVTTAEIEWLTGLGTYRSWQQAAQACPGGQIRAERIIAHARAAGAVDEPGECWWLSPAARDAARPELLALTGWHADPSQAIAARSAYAIAVEGAASVCSTLNNALQVCGLRTTETAYADIVVLAGRGHIDAISAHDEHSAVAHLPVRIHHTRAAIGPLVVPGTTPCCRCLALHARDRDAAWPAMAAQWRAWEPTQDADPLLVQRVAVEVVTVVREWIDTAGQLPAQRVHLALPRLVADREKMIAHQACGCMWQASQLIA